MGSSRCPLWRTWRQAPPEQHARSRTGSHRRRIVATSNPRPRETLRTRTRNREFAERASPRRRVPPGRGRIAASEADFDAHSRGSSLRSTPARNAFLRARSIAEPPLPQQSHRRPHGPRHVHLASALFPVVAEDERHFPEDQVHPAELEKDIDHALKAVLVE